MRTAQELEHLSAREPDSGLVRVVVDTPKGSRNKYKYDETLGLYRLSKVLPVGIAFPYDFGFIPSTRAEDGDPLDVLVLGEEALFPGCLVTVRLVGVIQAEQTEHGKTFRNDRLMGAIETPVNRPAIQTLDRSEDRAPGRDRVLLHCLQPPGRSTLQANRTSWSGDGRAASCRRDTAVRQCQGRSTCGAAHSRERPQTMRHARYP